MSLDNAYLLQNCNAGYCGNSPMFWREGGSGYTPWIAEAQVWTKEDAEFQIRSTRGSHTWEMWPLALIRQHAKATVDIQDLRKVVANGNASESISGCESEKDVALSEVRPQD